MILGSVTIDELVREILILVVTEYQINIHVFFLFLQISNVGLLLLLTIF